MRFLRKFASFFRRGAAEAPREDALPEISATARGPEFKGAPRVAFALLRMEGVASRQEAPLTGRRVVRSEAGGLPKKRAEQPKGEEALLNAFGKREKIESFSSREEILASMERESFDGLIVSRELAGSMSFREFILSVRCWHPETRIVAILPEEDLAEHQFLYQWMVFDVLAGKPSAEAIVRALDCPKEFCDIAYEMESIEVDREPYEAYDDEAS